MPDKPTPEQPSTDWQEAYFIALEHIKTETVTPADMSLIWCRVKAAILQSDHQQAELLAQAEALAALLQRYRDETPLGHSPHMICHEADQALTAFRAYQKGRTDA